MFLLEALHGNGPTPTASSISSMQLHMTGTTKCYSKLALLAYVAFATDMHAHLVATRSCPLAAALFLAFYTSDECSKNLLISFRRTAITQETKYIRCGDG